MVESRGQGGGGPTVQRMLVGARLRRLRTEMGLTREEAAEAIRASEWKIHRLENGQVGFKERDIVDLLRLYEVTDPAEVAEFVALAREANTPGWWQHYGDVLPQWFRTYVDLEAAAALIRTCCRPTTTCGRSSKGRTWRTPTRRWAGGCGCAWPARSC
jgi:transcriptional regulator with XRE-family HTH domain